MREQNESSRRPRILIVVKGLGLGGVERLLSRSIGELDRERYDYEVCYFTPWKDDVVETFESEGMRVHCLGVVRELSPLAIRRLARLIKEGSFDLVHTHSPYPSVLTRLVSASKPDLKVVHTEHSLPDSRTNLTRLANRLTYGLCDLVIAISDDVERAITSGRPRPPHTQVIRGGVATSELGSVDPGEKAIVRTKLGIPPNHAVIGNVAHLREQKGHALFLDVAERVLSERPETTFVLVGREKETGFEAGLRSRARLLGIERHVIFTGFVADPYAILSTFDIFLMTSRHEGFPVALIEAMASGVPVVATDVGGVGEAIAHETEGLLAPFGDTEKLAAHVLRLLDDESERSELASSAKRRVETHFTLKRMVQKVETSYEALLAGSAVGGR